MDVLFDILLERKDSRLMEGKVGLLCNQVSYHFGRREYLFHLLGRRGNLRRIFAPEHGLFAELQDQLPLDDGSVYGSDIAAAQIVSLYGENEASLLVRPEHLADLDALIVDIQDVGSRYYTFATTMGYMLRSLGEIKSDIAVYILDRPNPAGNLVEGTILESEYASFVGHPGLPHRHGLTVGELGRFFYHYHGGRYELNIITAQTDGSDSPFIPPSPNMPLRRTTKVYSGQCLWEGCNVSEGRGTTRPFEIFGAPYIQAFDNRFQPPQQQGAILRPLRFIPAFHKYRNEICEGWQLHAMEDDHHALAHTLRLIRFVKESWPDSFRFRRGIYEFQSRRPAIEILVGDSLMLDYLNGRCGFAPLRDRLASGEERWLREATDYLSTGRKLRRIEIDVRGE